MRVKLKLYCEPMLIGIKWLVLLKDYCRILGYFMNRFYVRIFDEVIKLRERTWAFKE